jgi:hypothetical protein
MKSQLTNYTLMVVILAFLIFLFDKAIVFAIKHWLKEDETETKANQRKVICILCSSVIFGSIACFFTYVIMSKYLFN